MALDIAAHVGVVGVMAVEMFVRGDQLYVNELAMRPHNSGHWTIDGAKTSQFEQHLRAVLDLPLGDPSMSARNVVMGNILGTKQSFTTISQLNGANIGVAPYAPSEINSYTKI